MFVKIIPPTIIAGLGRVAAKEILGLTGADANPLSLT
jgi:hypothetical protein